MKLSLPLGYGYGKRIKQIDSVVDQGKVVIATGTIQIWWEDKSTFEIELDPQYIVRRGVINCDVDGNLTRFEIDTNDTAMDSKFAFAKNGSFKRTSLGWHKDGKHVGSEQIVKAFGIEFREAIWDLSDEQYEKQTLITAGANTQIIDHSGEVTALSLAPSGRHWAATFAIIANVIAIVALSLAYLYKRRRKASY